MENRVKSLKQNALDL